MSLQALQSIFPPLNEEDGIEAKFAGEVVIGRDAGRLLGIRFWGREL